MDRIGKSFAILIILALFIPSLSLLIVKPASAQPTLTLQITGFTETTISFSWSGESGYRYQIWELASVPGDYYILVWQSMGDNSITSAYVDNLSPDSTYSFYLKVDGSVGGSPQSNTVEDSTSYNPVLKITNQTQSSVTLQWYPHNEYTALVPFNSYTIQMRTENGNFSTIATITNVTQSAYVVTGLAPSTTYQFKQLDVAGTSGQYQSSSDIETASTLYSTTPTLTPTPTPTPTTTPTVPEFPAIAILPLLLSVFAVAIVLKHRKAKHG